MSHAIFSGDTMVSASTVVMLYSEIRADPSQHNPPSAPWPSSSLSIAWLCKYLLCNSAVRPTGTWDMFSPFQTHFRILLLRCIDRLCSFSNFLVCDALRLSQYGNISLSCQGYIVLYTSGFWRQQNFAKMPTESCQVGAANKVEVG